jgi:Mg2+-importing ATPase
MGNPFHSRPSRALTATTLTIAAVGAILPSTPLGARLGFVPLPLTYYWFLAAATLAYLALVDLAKQRLARRLAVV